MPDKRTEGFDPLIAEILIRMPDNKKAWTMREKDKWFSALRSAVDMIYDNGPQFD